MTPTTTIVIGVLCLALVGTVAIVAPDSLDAVINFVTSPFRALFGADAPAPTDSTGADATQAAGQTAKPQAP